MTTDATSERCQVCGRSGSKVRHVTKDMVLAALRVNSGAGERFAIDDYTTMRHRIVAALAVSE